MVRYKSMLRVINMLDKCLVYVVGCVECVH